MKKIKRGIIFLIKTRFYIQDYASNICSKILLWLNDVEFKKGLFFFGIPQIRTAKSASIRIGSDCVFRSNERSNLIGINRKCVLFADVRAELDIGNSCGFSGTVIGCFKNIKIGHNVRCGGNSLITDGDWHFGDPRVSEPQPIVISDNVWLGVDVIVLKGVKIGENSIIGAGSIVVSDIPANVIAAGNPCKVIRKI